MKCEVCKKNDALKNVVICSDRCEKIRQALFDLGKKYFPTNGCDNCWGDLHHGCSEQCKKEFSESLRFGQDLWKLTRLILDSEKSHTSNNLNDSIEANQK